MKLSFTFVTFLLLVVAPVTSEDIVFSDYQVYEFDEARFAPNDTKPTLYDIRFVGKEQALWIEGQDYNYQWLTIVPYSEIKSVTLNHARGNPFVKDTGSWIGRQLAKAGDIRGWFTIGYTDSKHTDKKLVLLAPVNGDRSLADLLVSVGANLEQTGGTKVKEAVALTLPQPTVQPVASPPVSPLPAVVGAEAPAVRPAIQPQKLIDLMTVSEFRTAGLGKLTDKELAALDVWIHRYF
ncbi:MAG: hypothetical protein VX910_08325 [Candidatus Latescibacterota bacterium]|nr:hypothetical protein [Candidatus Latescibacterota bacterium]